MALIAGAVGTAFVVGNMFGSSAKLRAAKAAMQQLQLARQQGITEAKSLTKQFDPFIAEASGAINEAKGFDITSASFDPLLQRLLATAEAGATEGLTASDRIAFEDAKKLMNENLVATGNLRSGAAGYYNDELTRRVLADSANRRMQYLNLAFGGQQQGATQRLNLLSSVLQRGQLAGSIGLSGKQLATNLFTASMGLAPAAANMNLMQGQAQADFASAAGSIPQSIFSGMQMQQDYEQSQAYTKYLQSKTA